MALVAACAGSGPAGAVDWQVLYRLSETLRGSDNLLLRPDPEGVGGSSRTNGQIEIRASTPRAEWSATGNVGQLLYFGEGVPDDRSRTTTSAKSDFLKRTRDTDYFVNANVSVAPATRTVSGRQFPGLPPELTDPDQGDVGDPELPEELTDIEEDVLSSDRISFGGSAGLVHRRTRRDDLSLAIHADRVDFTEQSAATSPHTLLRLTGSWDRHFPRRWTGRVNGAVAYFREEDAEDTQRLIYDVGLGATVLVTPRLTVSANAGVNVVDQNRDDEGSDLTVGTTGSADVTYTPRRDTNLSLGVSQRVSPDSLGDLRTTQSVQGALSHQINHLSSFNLTGSFTTSDSTGDDDTGSRLAWRISPRYVRTLTQNWDMSLGYQWTLSDSGSDTNQSNTVFLTLTHHGTILP